MRIVWFLLLVCSIGAASTLTNGTFGPSDPNVIGSALLFDPQSISVSISSTSQLTAVIDLDFGNGASSIFTSGGNQSLTSFADGPATIFLGDLFFYSPSAPLTTSCSNASPPAQCMSVPTPSSLAYAAVLDGGNGLTAGDLYAIDNGTTVTNGVTEETGTTFFGSTGYIYRPSQVVEVAANSGTTVAATGSEAVCGIGTAGCGTGSAQYQVTLSFSEPAAFKSLVLNNQIGVEFAAAECGNAVLAGSVGVATPEPGTVPMFAAGLCLVGFGLVRRRR